MELNAWTLVEQDGEHVLHNSNNMLHGNLMHSVPNTASECGLMSMDVCQDASSRNISRIVIDRRLHGQEERNDYVGGIDNESLDFSQLEDFINNETDTDPSYFGDTLSHDNATSQHLPTTVNGVPGGVDQNAANRTLHQHHLTQPSHQHHLLNKTQVVPASISAVTYNTTIPNISLDSTYTYAHSHHSLPESPPDSGSEPPYSPPDVQKTANGANIQEILLQTNGSTTPNGLVSLPYVKSPLQHAIQMQNSCGETILLQHSTILTPLLTQQQQQQQQQQHQNVLTSPVSPGLSSREGSTSGQHGNSLANGDTSPYLNPHNRAKKRKLSQDGSNVLVKQEPDAASSHANALAAAPAISTAKEDDFGYQDSNSNGPGSVNNDSGVYLDSSFQCIRFQPFQQTSWHALCDQNLKELPVPHYRVDADKGFNFSNADDAFVCQKKNHFQITCHAQLEGEAQFVKTSKGIRKISSFHLHFYGVKVESPSQTIKVEQSQSDRSKKAFHPVLIDLRSDQVTKVTVGRLHFSETTSNNMRKKGKPNPDQRYFYLVVGLHAHCNDSSDYPIVSHSSEKIIVRASNPGQFENDVELCWQRGSSPDSVFHAGRVGINTDRPDEALVVHGNVKVTGHIMKPSDCRIKTNIQKCDHKEQLRNIQQLNVVRFTYNPEFSTHFGLVNNNDTGVLAQEVQKILPEAVTTAGSIVLPDGTKFENFLLVDKERIYMENVGAVKELCKVTDNLETRIDELERMNRKLVRLRRHDSTKSTSSYSTVLSGKSRSNSNISGKPKISSCADINLCSNHYLQAIIIILVFVIAVCLASIATLYFLEFRNAYTANLSSYLNNEKLNRLRSQWSASTPPQWSSIIQSNEFNRHNITDLKLIHHMPNKLRSKDRQTSSFSYQPSVSDYPLDADSIAANANQKITKHKLKPSLQVNNPPHNSNSDDKSDENYAVNDLLPTALGRPSHCNTMFSSHNSLLHYWDTPSPCQSFCCFQGVIHNSDYGNEQASQDSLKATLQDHGQASTDFIANIGQMTPAANTLEDTQIISALGYTSKDSISGLGQDQHFNKKESKLKTLTGNKNSIELGVQRRRRYATETWSNIDQYQKGINEGITVSVHGSNFNQTINSSYCSIDSPQFIQCKHGSAANISYIIPLSKYLSDNHIYLIFQFSKLSKYQKVTRCSNIHNTANVECPAKNLDIYWMKNEQQQQGPKVPNENMKNFSRTDAYFHVDISNSLELLEKYRVYLDNSANSDICEASSDKLGVSYLEYNFSFQRHCGE